MKKLSLVIGIAAFALAASTAKAQTATGTLTVSATVQGSINLVFNSATGGVALTGTGTNAATLGFGNVSAYGTIATAGVARTVGTNNFTVSSAVDVAVSETNSSSSAYTLTAELGTADATNAWSVGGTAVTGASPATITATGTYTTSGLGTNYAVAIAIPFTEASGTAISNTINYTATAN